VQDINHLTKADRVNSPISIAIVVLDNFEKAWPLPFPRLRLGVLAAELREAKRIAEFILHRIRKCEEFALGRTDPVERPFSLRQPRTHQSYPRFRIV
jgi:hypothetical protein